MSTFQDGSGVKQGPVVPDQKHLAPPQALVLNEPEFDGGYDFQRPWPTDEGGTSNGGWMKTAEYPDGYYGVDSGPFRQV